MDKKKITLPLLNNTQFKMKELLQNILLSYPRYWVITYQSLHKAIQKSMLKRQCTETKKINRPNYDLMDKFI